ncbi:MAG TPA: hypothetical protein VGQ03_07795 [Nitrososphaera sp.]|nr:hypothetical protein [Nitrososphaera sp.]
MVYKSIAVVTTIGLVLLSLVTQTGLLPVAIAQSDELLTEEQALESLNGPIFLDAYWTDRNSSSNDSAITRKEVGPGQGSTTLAVVLANRGTSEITAVTGTMELPDGFSSYGAAGAQVTTARASFYQLVGEGETFTLLFDVVVSDNAKVGAYTSNLVVEFNKVREVGSFRDVELAVPFRLTGKPILEVNPIAQSGGVNQTTSAITAGQVEDFDFELANTGTTPITNVVVTIESPSESTMILGKSTWSIERIAEGSRIPLSTKVFAADSLIGNPTSFDVTVDYSSNGEENSKTFKLGTYVAGEIKISAYDLSINYIGDTPNLVGNLLNEGNTAALFTTIQLVQSPANASEGAGRQLPISDTPPQYLGDLTENSPLPFSVPLNLPNGFGPGSYTVTLSVSYKDDVRDSHEFVASENVVLQPQQPTNEGQRPGSPISGFLLPLVVGGIVAVVVIVILLRRRRSKKMHLKNDTESEENIEDILTNPTSGTKEDRVLE